MHTLSSIVVSASGSSSKIDWGAMAQASVKVLLVGLVFGAGLPALYAIGMRTWALGTDTVHEDGTVTKGNPALMVVGAICYLIVLAAVVCGLLLIMQKTIDHYLGVTIKFPGMS